MNRPFDFFLKIKRGLNSVFVGFDRCLPIASVHVVNLIEFTATVSIGGRLAQ